MMPDGWMPGVERRPIQWSMADWNKRTDMKPVVVIDHIAQGFIQTIVDWASNGQRKIITHFAISRSGRIVQFHPIFSPGIHATGFNHLSPYAAKRVRERTASPNMYSIGIEHEGFSVDPGYGYDYLYSAARPWPEAMVEASIRVKAWCFANAPSLGSPSTDSIIGHYETGDADRVNDPAPVTARGVWPRDRMVAEIRESVPSPVPPPAGRLDWGSFYANGAEPYDIRRRNPTTLEYRYLVKKYVKG